MKLQSNPFLALEDVIATLESLGAHPLSEDSKEWTSKILGMHVDMCYTEDCEVYQVTQIQLRCDGFIKFLDLVETIFEDVPREELIKREAYYPNVGRRLKMSLGENLELITFANEKQEEIIYGSHDTKL